MTMRKILMPQKTLSQNSNNSNVDNNKEDKTRPNIDVWITKVFISYPSNILYLLKNPVNNPKKSSKVSKSKDK